MKLENTDLIKIYANNANLSALVVIIKNLIKELLQYRYTEQFLMPGTEEFLRQEIRKSFMLILDLAYNPNKGKYYTKEELLSTIMPVISATEIYGQIDSLEISNINLKLPDDNVSLWFKNLFRNLMEDISKGRFNLKNLMIQIEGI